ncbi:MAG TPA: PQQ-binding-like beta-propeller repeat protein [Thermoguttaceae bacterium]|nr:PQQ-binding-like beta-propeller repeat protein [Thermoguttaceae bacterium]
MLRLALAFGLVLTYCFAISCSAHGEDWPGWRGPRGDGTSLETNVPLGWDGPTGENVLWKVEVPGAGHASPIVWGDHVFLVSCLEESEERILVSFDGRSGARQWQRTVLRAPLETRNRLNSFASSTPATDGELVYVTFLEVDGSTVEARNVSKPRPVTLGRMVVAAYDFQGDRRWIVRPGEFASAHGYCSSPVLYDDLVIINGDHDGDSYVVALRKATGEMVWKRPREHKTRSYVPPIIREIDGRTQMVFSGSRCIVSLDPRDGSRHWKIDGPTEQFVASMVYDGKRFYMTAGFPTYHVMGIRPDGEGNVTETHVAWHVTNARCYVPSPVVLDGYLLVADDRGTANCFRADTGERLWQERLGKHYSTSLVTAKGLAFFLADDGVMKIVRPGPKLEVVAENELGEDCRASPAISGGRIFLRGEGNLYCIGSTESVGQ